MKKVGSWLLLVTLSVSAGFAQVTVEVALGESAPAKEQLQFLPGEAFPVAVRITNRSGQPLRFGAKPDWLTFSIESRDGFVTPKAGDPPVQGEFVLESSKMATKRLDLAPFLSPTEPGHYTLIATVKVREWNREIVSAPKGFDIVQGARLWEQDFGVPPTAGSTNAAPEIRKYMLQQANYLKTQLRLYLRLTDSTGGKTFRVFPIGPMVSFSRPEPQVDKQSNLHVLYQSGPSSFSYTVFNPKGELLVRQTHDYLATKPRLRADAEGVISVTGGRRRVTPADVPPVQAPGPSP
jgi:hypothetical protein